jgi:hypothetical protein
MSTLEGASAWVTTEVKEHNTSICMPAEFYTLLIKNFNLNMEMRYCPCEFCNKITYVELFTCGNDHKIDDIELVVKQIRKAIPDLSVYISNLHQESAYNACLVKLQDSLIQIEKLKLQ